MKTIEDKWLRVPKSALEAHVELYRERGHAVSIDTYGPTRVWRIGGDTWIAREDAVGDPVYYIVLSE